jgi:GTP cyclohydrolase FolE2
MRRETRTQLVTLNHWILITYNTKTNLKSQIYKRSVLKSLKERQETRAQVVILSHWILITYNTKNNLKSLKSTEIWDARYESANSKVKSLHVNHSEYGNQSHISYPEAQRSQIFRREARDERRETRAQVVILNHWILITRNTKTNLKSQIYKHSVLKSLKERRERK